MTNNGIKVVCAWCGVTITEGRRDRQGEVSHGMCRTCANLKRVTYTDRDGTIHTVTTSEPITYAYGHIGVNGILRQHVSDVRIEPVNW